MLKNGRNLHTHTHTHTHGCLCKTIIPIIATFAIINPIYADINKNAQSATCDSNTIGTTTGPANLQAAWTANTINLKWYNGNNEISIASGAAPKTCTYDGAITLPSTPNAPSGYTFGGWRVKNPFKDYDISLNGIGEGFKSNNGASSSNTDTYDLTSNGTWAVEFDYGTAYGIASCNQTANPAALYYYTNAPQVLSEQMSVEDFIMGLSSVATQEQVNLFIDVFTRYLSGEITSDEAGAILVDTFNKSSTQFNQNDTGQYCWCQTIGLKTITNGMQRVSGLPWIYDWTFENQNDCARDCAAYCSDGIMGADGAGMRTVGFGVF